MSIKNYLELSYHFENGGQGIVDEFASQFDLNREFTISELAIFLKIFFYKIHFLDKKIIDIIIPYKIVPHNNNSEVDKERMEEESLDEWEDLQDYFSSLTDDINKIANNKENIDHFKKQIQENPEMLREAFKSFLRDTMSE